MKIIKVIFENGYLNAYDSEHIYILKDNYTELDIENVCREDFTQFCDDNILGVQGYDFNEGWETEEDEEDYYSNCYWSYSEITLEELKEWCLDNACDEEFGWNLYNGYRAEIGLNYETTPIDEEVNEKKYIVTITYNIPVNATDANTAMDPAEMLIKENKVSPDMFLWDEVE